MKRLLLLLLIPLNVDHHTVITRFLPPQGYSVIIKPSNRFGNWLISLPLKPVGSHTLTYKGNIAQTDAYTAGVIDMSVGQQDLQQCADAVMRLRAEFLFQQKAYDAISFNFVNGFKCNYRRYADGYRYINNKWVLKTVKNYSYPVFMQYMSLVFAYAGTLSLEKELVKVDSVSDLKAGDVFIHGGSPGHCFIVLAVAENAIHQRLFLLAQSFMPAQNIQVVKNPGGSPWFSLSSAAGIPYGNLIDIKYLRRFKD